MLLNKKTFYEPNEAFHIIRFSQKHLIFWKQVKPNLSNLTKFLPFLSQCLSKSPVDEMFLQSASE